MSQQVLARFIVTSLELIPWYGGDRDNRTVTEAIKVKLSAAQGEPFGSATPQGSIEMVIVNPVAAAVFLESHTRSEFDVLFTRREKEE